MNDLDHYLKLAKNLEKLKRASRSLLRRSRSAQARRIRSGDVTAIVRAARDRVVSWARQQGNDFCEHFCRWLAKARAANAGKIKLADLLANLLSFLAGLANAPAGLVLALIWLYREEMIDTVCECPSVA